MKSGEKKLKQSRPPLFIDDQSDWPDLSDLLLLFHGPAKRFDILTKQEKLSQVQEGKQLGDWYAVSSQKKNFGVVMCSAWGQFVIDVFWQSEFDRSCLSYPNTTLPFSRQVTSTLTACSCVVPVGKSKKKKKIPVTVPICIHSLAKDGQRGFFFFSIVIYSLDSL